MTDDEGDTAVPGRPGQDSLNAALDSRRFVELAQGILMQQRGVDREQAFLLLVQASQGGRRRMRDIASDVVSAAGGA